MKAHEEDCARLGQALANNLQTQQQILEAKREARQQKKKALIAKQAERTETAKKGWGLLRSTFATPKVAEGADGKQPPSSIWTLRPKALKERLAASAAAEKRAAAEPKKQAEEKVDFSPPRPLIAAPSRDASPSRPLADPPKSRPLVRAPSRDSSPTIPFAMSLPLSRGGRANEPAELSVKDLMAAIEQTGLRQKLDNIEELLQKLALRDVPR